MSVSSSAQPAASSHSRSSERGPALAVENFSVRYGEAFALSGVPFGVGTGKALVVLGAYGAGKSSLDSAIFAGPGSCT
jgi:ABC-type branched-subunit amino acid transport system ATPase component